jgi:hypothetical protein
MKILSKLDLIRGAAKALATARAKLSSSVARLTAAVDAAHRRHLPVIRQHVGSVADAEANLRGALEAAPELFQEPRSITEAGIKCGYQRQDACLNIPGAKAKREAIVDAVKRMFTEDQISQHDLIDYVEVPNAETLLEHCTEKQIERLVELGAEHTPAGDRILIKPADAAIDKLVAKLLKVASEAAQEEGGR